jgi:GMP synthase (glutamine-hydrolysing)
MYVGKAEVFDAVTVHLDEVETLSAGMTVLATNATSQVQSAEFRHNGVVAWGVQYHPEYPLREIAAIVRRAGLRLVEEGFFTDADDLKRYAGELDALHTNPKNKALAWRHGLGDAVLDRSLRVREVQNWLNHQVLPTRTHRGRA